jgi:glucokinase
VSAADPKFTFPGTGPGRGGIRPGSTTDLRGETPPGSRSLIVGAIDLGGHSFRAAAVGGDGSLLDFRIQASHPERGPQQAIERMVDALEAVLGDNQPAAIGVGSTGPLDRAQGRIHNPYTLPGWEDVAITAPLTKHFGAPAFLENDADAAALGEAWLGLGRGAARFICVTLGTGVGVGLVLDGRLYRGADGVHPEIGHMVIDLDGPECYCGSRGCWEQLCSGPAIGRLAGEGLTGEQVGEAARQGDERARVMLGQAGHYLGVGLANLIVGWFPSAIALTGRVMDSFPYMEASMREVLARQQRMVPGMDVRVRRGTLGQRAGVLGAARAALLELSRHPMEAAGLGPPG